MWTRPTGWRRPTRDEVSLWAGIVESGTLPASAWRGDGSIRPSDLYCYLKCRFGEPNGFLTFLAQPHSDNLFHWDYLLACDEGFVQFLSGNSGTEARVWSAEFFNAEAWPTLISNLKDEFRRHGHEMGAVRRSLEKWQLFVNPFKRLERTVHVAAEELAELELTSPPRLPVGYDTKEEYEGAVAELRDYTTRLNRASELGLLIRYLCPVLAEAFVNMVIFVCAKPALRERTTYEATVRQHIGPRVLRLHETCNGFERPIDAAAFPFKDFLRLMDHRNHLLHGNVDPMRGTFDTVLFDGHRPIFMEEDNLALRLPRKSTEWLAPRLALADIDVVETFITHVWDCMEPQWLETLMNVMGESQPGWRKDTGRVGILFPERIVFSVGYGRQSRGEPA